MIHFTEAVLDVLEERGALRIAGGRGVDPYSAAEAYARTALFARPKTARQAAALALRAYRKTTDTDALGNLVKVSAWMEKRDAAWLFTASLGAGTPPSLTGLFAGWGGLAQLAGVLFRAGGERAVRGAIDAVLEGAGGRVAPTRLR